jgi:acyl carrier protein
VTKMEHFELEATVREIVCTMGRLTVDSAELGDGDDLFDAGMSSHASVNVMLAIEEAFDIEFPEAMLRKQTFESIRAIADALGCLIESGIALSM